MLAFVQSHSQSQARLMFVNCSTTWTIPKVNAHFKKFTACLWEGLIHEC